MKVKSEEKKTKVTQWVVDVKILPHAKYLKEDHLQCFREGQKTITHASKAKTWSVGRWSSDRQEHCLPFPT
jgi:hypothetical protein